jgi:hypothetical protein
MLKQAVEDLKERDKINIISGFRACGIVPFNPEAVLQKIKTTDRGTTPCSSSLESSMSEVLDQLKTDQSPAPKRRKKKSIIPGKSIGLGDLKEVNKAKPTVQKRKKKNKSDSEEDQEENEILEEIFDSSGSECDQEPQQDRPGSECEQEHQQGRRNISPDDYEIGESSTAPTGSPDPPDFRVGDYVIPTLKTNKRSLVYRKSP